jgi:hypothetical protein
MRSKESRISSKPAKLCLYATAYMYLSDLTYLREPRLPTLWPVIDIERPAAAGSGQSALYLAILQRQSIVLDEPSLSNNHFKAFKRPTFRMAFSRDIILYLYTFSPYARRVVWYLNLRKIPYTQCVGPQSQV